MNAEEELLAFVTKVRETVPNRITSETITLCAGCVSAQTDKDIKKHHSAYYCSCKDGIPTELHLLASDHMQVINHILGGHTLKRLPFFGPISDRYIPRYVSQYEVNIAAAYASQEHPFLHRYYYKPAKKTLWPKPVLPHDDSYTTQYLQKRFFALTAKGYNKDPTGFPTAQRARMDPIQYWQADEKATLVDYQPTLMQYLWNYRRSSFPEPPTMLQMKAVFTPPAPQIHPLINAPEILEERKKAQVSQMEEKRRLKSKQSNTYHHISSETYSEFGYPQSTDEDSAE